MQQQGQPSLVAHQETRSSSKPHSLFTGVISLSKRQPGYHRCSTEPSGLHLHSKTNNSDTTTVEESLFCTDLPDTGSVLQDASTVQLFAHLSVLERRKGDLVV